VSFAQEAARYAWDDLGQRIRAASEDDVARAFGADPVGFDHLLALLSPAAAPHIEAMAQAAHRLTLRRFGRVVGLYAPLYLSNACTNACLYCGFNRSNPFDRITLSSEGAEREARALRARGFRHVLLVSGEDPDRCPVAYFEDVIARLRPLFSSISLEIYPMAEEDYRKLCAAGADGLVLYQETYNPETYARFHPAGRKRDFVSRVETHDRAGRAGFRRLGLGALLGLDDWRIEAAFLALHARHIQRTAWRSQITISFPRLRRAAGGCDAPMPVADPDLVQMLCALRLHLPDTGLVLSTREKSEFRDHLIPLGVTLTSAGSRTSPGAYAHADLYETEGQFEIADMREPEEVAEAIARLGYEPVWKDWDAAFAGPCPAAGREPCGSP